MKLGAALTLVGLCSSAAAIAAATGCSSSDSSSTASEIGKVPPGETGALTTAPNDKRTFAVNSIMLGEADRSGNKNKDAWKSYGYNLDGLITNVTDRNSPSLSKVCKLAAGAVATTHQDGNDGIDNSFGKNILTLLDPFTPNPSKDVTDGIVKGDFTIMLQVNGLTDDAAQTATGLGGKILVGGTFDPQGKTAPTFSPTDDWPYYADPQVDMTGSYINGGEFVNGKGGATIKLAIGVSGENLELTINRAIVTFKHNPATKSLDEGTIAGVINTAEFANGLRKIAGRFAKDLCSGSTVDGIISSIQQASDMMADGSQNPNAPCDGISIGLGFTAKQVANPTKTATPGDAGADPCAAGAGDGGT